MSRSDEKITVQSLDSRPDRRAVAAPAVALARIAGPLTVASGLLLTVTQIVQLLMMNRYAGDLAAMTTDPRYVVNAVTQFVVFCLLVVAVVAAHQWQADRAGMLGLVGLAAALVGIVNLGGNYWFEAFVTPWLMDAAPGLLDVERGGVLLIGGLTSYLAFGLGWVLFGCAAWRARVFPRGVAGAVVAGGVLGLQTVQPPLGVPLGLALIWLGTWMLRSRPVRAAW